MTLVMDCTVKFPIHIHPVCIEPSEWRIPLSNSFRSVSLIFTVALIAAAVVATAAFADNVMTSLAPSNEISLGG